jgi:succinylarginine dihydrolase
MKNGGGPACLRNRVVLNEKERAAVPPRLFLDRGSFADLETWADRHYRESVILGDFLDPLFRNEVEAALDELTQILSLGSIYPFQKI